MSDTESVNEEHKVTKDRFKRAVAEWMKVNESLDELRKEVSELNKKKKKLNEVIILFMKSNEAEYCNLGNDGAIELKKQKTYQALKKVQVEELLKELGKSEKECKDTAEFLFAHKTIKETDIVKRSKSVFE
tara:strand:+ start:487 stop:879 length:393 start_codon:yes stop_codon:yes gene_type:complete